MINNSDSISFNDTLDFVFSDINDTGGNRKKQKQCFDSSDFVALYFYFIIGILYFSFINLSRICSLRVVTSETETVENGNQKIESSKA